MRIGLISDVHGNIVALERVLEKLNSCDIIYSAGDVVGYYPYPNETIEKFIETGIESVFGNHDYAVVKSDFSGMNPYATEAARYTRRVIDRKKLEWLSSLPLSIKTEYFVIYHGMPAEDELAYTVYLFPEDPLIEFLVEKYGITVVGHTHIQFIEYHDKRMLINPGSVGQPRDGDSRAAYAIFDTESGKVNLERVEYNIQEAYDAVLNAGLPEFLGKRLFEGR
ncbi:MAG TPA: metallophosphoesterase [Archaeoglobaceae archaeon]|nr:metallophosphoesterase [Archaeoglobaceae archaeon]